MVYDPILLVSTVPVVVTATFPSLLSVAVAPGSLKVSSSLRLITASPFKTITGGVVSASSSTVIVLVTVTAALPAASAAS
jgi:hypothetical protein